MFCRLKTLKDKGSDSEDSNSSSSSSSSSGSDSSVDDQEKHQNTENNGNDEEEEDDLENLILEKLKNKAKILQELGGEISEEIKELIEPSSDIEELNLVEESQTESYIITTEETDKGVTDKTELPPKIEDEQSDTVILLEINEELVTDIPDSSVEFKGVEAVSTTETKEENYENVATNNVETTDSKLELLLQEKAPTSFSLIAGYGNEDDSEVDEDKSEDTTKSNENIGPLFPIVENEKKSLIKNVNVKVIKLSGKCKELIRSSTTTGKARATDFVSTSDGLRPCKDVSSGTYVLNVLMKLC